MNVGLMAAALFFTAIDAVSFLACGVLMMRFICMLRGFLMSLVFLRGKPGQRSVPMGNTMRCSR